MTKRRLGDFLKIPLPDGTHSYGRVLPDPIIGFYDVKTTKELSLEAIETCPLLFRVWVMKYVFTKSLWPSVGNLPLEKSLEKHPDFFIQDSINPNQISIYRNGDIFPASREEVQGLERASAWDPEHIESRLMDHFSGKPNIWVNQAKLK